MNLLLERVFGIVASPGLPALSARFCCAGGIVCEVARVVTFALALSAFRRDLALFYFVHACETLRAASFVLFAVFSHMYECVSAR